MAKRIDKITEYNLKDYVLSLRRSGYKQQEIVDLVNAKLPNEETIDRFVLIRFLNKYTAMTKDEDVGAEPKILQHYATNMDIISETQGLYFRAKELLDKMEKASEEAGYPHVDPYRFKAVSEVMIALQKQMIDIQKEVSEYNNIIKFFEMIMEILKEECPEKIPSIIEKLKTVKSTKWFSAIMSQMRNKR